MIKELPEKKELPKVTTKSKEYRIYRPQKDVSKGAATKWNIRNKNDKYGGYMVFVEATLQKGVDANENASFYWEDKEKTIKMKLEETDLGSILATLTGVTSETKLFHKNETGNTVLALTPQLKDNKLTGGFYLKVSRQRGGKTSMVNHSIGVAEAQILRVLLQDGISAMFQWN